MPSRYRKIQVEGKTLNLHRHVVEQALGVKLGPDVVVHHRNHDRFDNRLENLEVLTHREHAQLHVRKHPDEKPCKHCGATFTPAPTKRKRQVTCSRACFSAVNAEREHIAKLTPALVLEIRALAKRGSSNRSLAARYGVHPDTIGLLLRGKTWRHVA